MQEEETKEVKHTFSDMTVNIEDKINALSKSIGKTVEEKKEYAKGKINEKPLAYMTGAFFGGVIMGYAMRRRKS